MTRASTTQAEAMIAEVSRARWRTLLRVYHGHLRHEDLEDCLAQATLELVVQARRGTITTADAPLLAGALEHKFKSRIIDRRRAISGRSPAATAEHHATQIDAITDLLPARHDTQAHVITRDELHLLISVFPRLTRDQRLVIRHQIDPHAGRPADFCDAHGWTLEKYRKVGQRARARLTTLVHEQREETVDASRRARVSGS